MRRIREYATQEGRDPADIGIEKVFGFSSDHTGDLWPVIVSAWRDLGVTRVCISTMEDLRLTTLDAHINAIRLFKESTFGL